MYGSYVTFILLNHSAFLNRYHFSLLVISCIILELSDVF